MLAYSFHVINYFKTRIILNKLFKNGKNNCVPIFENFQILRNPCILQKDINVHFLVKFYIHIRIFNLNIAILKLMLINHNHNHSSKIRLSRLNQYPSARATLEGGINLGISRLNPAGGELACNNWLEVEAWLMMGKVWWSRGLVLVLVWAWTSSIYFF